MRLGLVFGARKARAIVRAWKAVLADQPQLLEHLVALGGMLDPGIDPDSGQPISAELHQYRAGRRDLAMTIISLADMDWRDLSVAMREIGDVDDEVGGV